MDRNLSENIEFPDQKIVDCNMEGRVRSAFLEYSMSVITSRALPDVRDGMKPGQRRILYAMYEDGLTYDKPFRKSATTVGDVLGRYHPHGDAAVYQTMVRMAQSFSLRYPLIQGHGNFGNVDGDGAAAYRYTEARLAKISGSMMTDIEKNVVAFTPNFDNSRREPVVLPSRFPNILVNGAVGIAVGMATYIPPHNLREVIDGTIYRMDHPDCSVDELMEHIKGPDFPTAGIVYGSRGMHEAYATGRGKVILRGRAEVDDEHKRIVITEIPYMVNKSELVKAIADLHRDKRVDGITALRDESGRAGMRIVIEYRRDANGEVILNQLYKFSQLQITVPVNMLALVGGEPKVLPLAAILDQYIAFQEDVVRRRTQFDLDRALKEMHIFEGYCIAIDHIDEVIELIKRSESIPDAKARLMERFGLSDPQAQAIVEMTLGKLSGLERQKIEERLARLQALVAELQGILADESRVRDLVRTEMSEIGDKFGDSRRTELVEAGDDIDLEDLIPRHTCVITLTNTGYIKRQPVDTYKVQNRGGKGIIGMTTKEDDFVERVLVTGSHSTLMLFTNRGKVFTKRAYLIPEAKRTAKGTNLVNLLELGEGERVTAVISVDDFGGEEYLTMVTRRGVIKRTRLSEYEYQRRSGKIALTLDEGDELLFVRRTGGDGELLLATRRGNAVRFEESNVRTMGRLARGVRGITLEGEEDAVVGVVPIDPEKKLLTITQNGFAKRADFEEYRLMRNRGGKGVTCHATDDKRGLLAAAIAVGDGDDIMLMTDDGTVIRTRADSIPVYSRTAGGVIAMRLSDGAHVVTVARIEPDEEIDAQAAEAQAREDALPEEAPAADIPAVMFDGDGDE